MDHCDVILKVEHLCTSFITDRKETNIIKDISFNVFRGKMLAIVGESGCGKSVTAYSVCRLLSKNGRITKGKITFRPSDGKEYHIERLEPFGKEMRELRGKRISMIFQDSSMSLNPVQKVGKQVAESLLEHEKIDKMEVKERVINMFRTLGIPDPEKRYNEYPFQFSGGMRQRVMIAIAMICNPDLIIADEPTTALDVTIQAQTIELMKNLQKQYNKTIILITHNMGLVAESAECVMVMYMGRIVEYGSVEQIFNCPSHPYTKALLKSVPVLGYDGVKQLEAIEGNTPNPEDCTDGCDFANRCKYCQESCKTGDINVHWLEDGHYVRCRLFDECKIGGK